MTVMAAEAGTAEAEAGAAEASAGARQQIRRGGRTQQGTQARRTGGRTQQGTQRGRSVRPGPAGASQRRQPPSRRRNIPSVKTGKGSGTSYENAVLAEFVLAIVLVAATPFAKKDAPGVSPYGAQDLFQLTAIAGAYFLLALLAGVNRGAGRFSAWFGLLILLAVGLGEAARIAKLLDVFGLQTKQDAKAGGGQ